MHFAAFNGNIEILEYLLSHGGDIVKASRCSLSGVTVFHAAAQGDQPGALAFLKRAYENTSGRQGSDIGKFRDVKNSTSLHWACAKGSENTLPYLLAWGSDVNALDVMSFSPLHLAV